MSDQELCPLDTITMEEAMKLIEACVSPVAAKLKEQLDLNQLYEKERQLLRELVAAWADGEVKESILPWALNAIVNREPATAESLEWAASVMLRMKGDQDAKA